MKKAKPVNEFPRGWNEKKVKAVLSHYERQTKKAAVGSAGSAIVPIGTVERTILLIRGERVILDADLAELYGVETRALNQAVKRNGERFPDDFRFRLTAGEASNLMSHIVTMNSELPGRGSRSQSVTLKRGANIKYLPYAFTEHGAIMAANVLNSPRAVRMSVFIVRAFVRLRNLLSQHKELAAKFAELERKLDKHDLQIMALVEAIRQLMAPPAEPPRKPIGFHSEIGP